MIDIESIRDNIQKDIEITLSVIKDLRDKHSKVLAERDELWKKESEAFEVYEKLGNEESRSNFEKIQRESSTAFAKEMHYCLEISKAVKKLAKLSSPEEVERRVRDLQRIESLRRRAELARAVRAQKALEKRQSKGCPDHPKYTGRRIPRTGCVKCLAYYESKRKGEINVVDE